MGLWCVVIVWTALRRVGWTPGARSTQPHSILILWWHLSSRSCLPLLSNNDGSDIGQPHNGRDDTICDRPRLGVISKHESETTINDTERDSDPAVPQVAIRPDCPTLIFLVARVVEESKERLEEEQSEDEDADDWVILLKLIVVSSCSGNCAAAEGLTYPMFVASQTPMPNATM